MSDIRATTISDAAGTGPIAMTGQSAAKAWVNFAGAGTIAARDSFNVASLTDAGTGEYDVNYSSAMATANNATSAFSSRDVSSSQVGMFHGNSLDSGKVRIIEVAGANSFYDPNIVTATVHGDLA